MDELRKKASNEDVPTEVAKAIESQVWPSQMISYQFYPKELGVIDNLMVRNGGVIFPSGLQQGTLDIAHRGHPGVVSMRIWPYMDRSVENRVQECAECASVSQ